MVRWLRWLGITALVATLLVAWLGRPVQRGCGPPVHGPCDAITSRPHAICQPRSRWSRSASVCWSSRG